MKRQMTSAQGQKFFASFFKKEGLPGLMSSIATCAAN
jgi:hypothetical protein